MRIVSVVDDYTPYRLLLRSLSIHISLLVKNDTGYPGWWSEEGLIFLLITVSQSVKIYGVGGSFACDISKANMTRYHDLVGVDWGKLAWSYTH
jgi:hypothetical protein